VTFYPSGSQLSPGPINDCEASAPLIHWLPGDMAMSDLIWLADAQIERLAPFFPKSRGKARVDDRRVLSGITSSTATAALARRAGGLWAAQDAL
jgi:hypothetical protein